MFITWAPWQRSRELEARAFSLAERNLLRIACSLKSTLQLEKFNVLPSFLSLDGTLPDPMWNQALNLCQQVSVEILNYIINVT